MNFLLDSSYVIDLPNEMADGIPGPAIRWLRRNPRARLWISPVTMSEVLEGAVDQQRVAGYLGSFHWQGLHQSHALRAAMIQRRSARRMGENDAWQAAVALGMKGRIVGHDPKAFSRLGRAYVDHRADSE